ncbi:RAMP superfamily CRISPR-associated protein [Phycisphaerales bacterium]|nr:RAMP superfamily CRISPR-associated protein [Phycisphaerales bacterium]
MIGINRRIHRMVIELVSPLHIGGGPQDLVYDAPVVRNAFGHWTLPGSSIAGVLRSIVREIEGEENAAVTFGSIDRDLADSSAVLVSDGELLDFDGRSALRKAMAGESVDLPTDLRVIEDHVRLEDDLTGSAGTAAEGGKYDLEVVPCGVRFAIECECHDAQGSTVNRDRLAIAIDRIVSRGTPLGGHGGCGLGVVRAISHVWRDFDLSQVPDLVDFSRIGEDPTGPLSGATDASSPDSVGRHGGTGISGSVTLSLESSGPLLIGGAQGPLETEAGADMVFNRQPVLDWSRRRFVELPVIPGSGIRGLIRSRVVHALVTTGRPDSEVQSIIDEIFGSVSGGDGRRGSLRVEGAILEETAGTVIQHVGIDRLTGGSLRSALFSEAPIWNDQLSFDIRIHLDGLDPDHLAVLIQAIWDIHDGIAPIGGGTRRGNGQLRIASDPDGLHGLAITDDLHLDGNPLDDAGRENLEQRLLGVQLEEVGSA